ncbi:MAG: hypothetical protein JSS27_03395 [Planctomycetes bacterium]|nr:hypothetical protein [Planctomycetota bacterium]
MADEAASRCRSIRCARWPARLPRGKQYDPPVSSLDFFTTAAAITEAQVPKEHSLDGVNLIPYLTGERTGVPHPRMFWRTGGGASGAEREGNYKLLLTRDRPDELYDLDADVGEATDLASAKPDIVARLRKDYEVWNALNIAPLFQSPKPAQPKAKPKANTAS